MVSLVQPSWIQDRQMARSVPSILTALEAVKEQFDEDSDSYKAELLEVLAKARHYRRDAPSGQPLHNSLNPSISP